MTDPSGRHQAIAAANPIMVYCHVTDSSTLKSPAAIGSPVMHAQINQVNSRVLLEASQPSFQCVTSCRRLSTCEAASLKLQLTLNHHLDKQNVHPKACLLVPFTIARRPS
jgi:hypothetical protein